MKNILLIFALLISLNGWSQNKADLITGKWMVIPKQNLSITVYKFGNEYRGKVSWVKNTEKVKPGFIILEKLVYNPGSNTWEHGKIHNPNGGGTYSAAVKIKEDGTMAVHAYKGFKFMGTDKIFKRVK